MLRGRSHAPRMAYSSLTRVMREAAAASAESIARGVPVDEVAQERGERMGLARCLRAEDGAIDRRDFLKLAGGAVGLAGAATIASRARWFAGAHASSTSRIVIVGGGLAGLRCAHKLWVTYGIRSTVYEAETDHVGGRCWTLRNFFNNGQIGEHGGEFIDTDHTSVRALVTSLGLTLETANGGSLPGLSDLYYLDGARYTNAQASTDWYAAFPAFNAAQAAAPFPMTYNNYTAEAQRLDNMTVADWFDDPHYPQLQAVGGSTGRFAELCKAIAISEFGADWQTQTVLNLIYDLAYNDRTDFETAGGDEISHIKGGNDQMISKMLAALPADTLKVGTPLVALRDNGNSTSTCTFTDGANTFDVVADQVVLALPFTTLRNVDLTNANLSVVKMKSINGLNLGHNAKLHVQMNSRPWATAGFSGSAYTEGQSFQLCWDETVAQIIGGTAATSPGILLNFPGGDLYFPPWQGDTDHGPAPQADVDHFLAQAEPVFPGVTAAANGVAYRDWWLKDEWHHGAYSYFALGQYTSFVGIEGKQEGTIHFCGEHTSLNYQGYMEGAVEEGERAAAEVAGQ